ncbi:hypothetical protein Tco_0002685 [Tanacetum coccineum]
MTGASAVQDRLGQSRCSSRHGQRRSTSEILQRSDSRGIAQAPRRVSVSFQNTSDNEDAETEHLKSKNRYREDEDMSSSMAVAKRSPFARRIMISPEDKKGHAPNVKTYDGTGRSYNLS